MAKQNFDPYFEWLRIPPSEQPPTHYRLLSLARFESNSEQIENAVARLVTRLQSLSEGPHVEHAQRLLNDTAKARLCLSDPLRKSEYDDQLRESLGWGRMLKDAPASKGALKDRSTSSTADQPPPLPTELETDSAASKQVNYLDDGDASTTGGRGGTKPTKTKMAGTNSDKSSSGKSPSEAQKKLAAKRSAKKTSPGAMMWGTAFSLLLLIIIGGGAAYFAKQYFLGEGNDPSPNATTDFESEAQDQSFADLAKSLEKTRTLTKDTSKQPQPPAAATKLISITIPGEKVARKFKMGDVQTFTAPVLRVVKSQRGKTRYIYFSNDKKSMLIARLTEKNFPDSWTLADLQTLVGKKVTCTGIVMKEPKSRPLILELSTADDLVVVPSDK